MSPPRVDKRIIAFLGCLLIIVWSGYFVISARGGNLKGPSAPAKFDWPWLHESNEEPLSNDEAVTTSHKPTRTRKHSSVMATIHPVTTSESTSESSIPISSEVVPEVASSTSESLLPTSSQDAVVKETPESILMYEYDGASLKELCAQKSWVSSADTVLNCEGRVGGVGNTKQEILWCIRFAIETGASLIRPSIMLRSENIIDYQSGPIANLSYVFDLDLFESRIKEACPLLVLYDSIADVEKRGPVKRLHPDRWILPWDTSTPGEVKRPLNDFITQHRAGIGEISVIDLGFAQFQTEVCFDGAGVVNHFGGLLPFRQEAHVIASKVLEELSTRFNVPRAPHVGVPKDAFIGIHLRTEVDAIAAGFTSYEAQRDMYLQVVSSRAPAITVVYASSGNQSSVDDFGRLAAALPEPVSVVTKRDLLSKEDTELLDKLTWDQQALVDFLILEKSSYFAGVGDSSFSYGVAYTRHAISNEGSCVETRDNLPPNVWFQDELSMVFGREEWKGIYLGKIWP